MNMMEEISRLLSNYALVSITIIFFNRVMFLLDVIDALEVEWFQISVHLFVLFKRDFFVWHLRISSLFKIWQEGYSFQLMLELIKECWDHMSFCLWIKSDGATNLIVSPVSLKKSSYF